MLLASEFGADLCEIDVVKSADGIVVFHDVLLDRTTNGRGAAGSRSSDEIHCLDAGGWFGSEFAGEPVPTFQAALELAHNGGLGLIVEVKESYRFDTRAFLGRVADALVEAGSASEVVLTSFDEVALRIAKDVMPSIRTELITHTRLADQLALMKGSQIDALNMDLERFHPEDSLALHEAGLAVRVTLPDGAELDRLDAYGFRVRERLGTWLGEGLIDVLASDDARLARELVERYPYTKPHA